MSVKNFHHYPAHLYVSEKILLVKNMYLFKNMYSFKNMNSLKNCSYCLFVDEENIQMYVGEIVWWKDISEIYRKLFTNIWAVYNWKFKYIFQWHIFFTNISHQHRQSRINSFCFDWHPSILEIFEFNLISLRFVCAKNIQKQDRCTDFEVRFCCPSYEKENSNKNTCNNVVTISENLKKLEKVNLRKFCKKRPTDISYKKLINKKVGY